MINLAMEVPTEYLNQWNVLGDLDFALAHMVLRNERYARYYAQRPTGRKLILDNSMHELGAPLKVSELKAAAQVVRADCVIAPDVLGQVDRNKEWFTETMAELGGMFPIGAVMCGRSTAERARYLHYVAAADVLLLPFREPRLAWYESLQETIQKNWAWIHLLGVNEMTELSRFAVHAAHTPRSYWSVDTSKAIKWAVEGKRLDVLASLRGAPTSSSDLLELKDLSETTQSLVLTNINLLRSCCGATLAR